jgi:hypothetical protein
LVFLFGERWVGEERVCEAFTTRLKPWVTTHHSCTLFKEKKRGEERRREEKRREESGQHTYIVL